MRTANPALKDSTFRRTAEAGADVMTIEGTVRATALLLLIALASAAYTWQQYFAGNTDRVAAFILVGVIGGFVIGLVTIFNPQWSPISALIYALAEGLALGGLSAMMEAKYAGVPLQALLLTFAILAALLMAYRSGLIRPSENMKLGIVAATGGIAIFYLVALVLGMFGIGVPLLHSNSLYGLAFSLFLIAVAAANLVLDFDFIESGTQYGAPAYMEWYGAFGLVLTLFWLYLEIARFLIKLKNRD